MEKPAIYALVLEYIRDQDLIHLMDHISKGELNAAHKVLLNAIPDSLRSQITSKHASAFIQYAHWDYMTNQQRLGMPEEHPITSDQSLEGMRVVAKATRMVYASMIGEGFPEEQAMLIAKQYFGMIMDQSLANVTARKPSGS